MWKSVLKSLIVVFANAVLTGIFMVSMLLCIHDALKELGAIK